MKMKLRKLKKMLIEKEEEIEALGNELERLKVEYNNLSINYTEAAQQLESLAEIEQKYSNLLKRDFLYIIMINY